MKKILLGFAAVMLMTGCSKNEVMNETESNQIKFTSVVGNSLRATNGLIDLPALKGSDDGFVVSTSGLGSEMTNLPVIYDSGNWKYAGIFYWPLNPTQNVSFAAYAPANSLGTATVSVSGTTGLSITGYSPNATQAQQVDIIYAAPTNFTRAVSAASGVQLAFNHILTQVVFSVTSDIQGSDQPKIVSISVNIPNGTGSFSTGAWTTASGAKTYSVFNSDNLNGTPKASDPLLMLPQTTLTGIKATITVSVKGQQSSRIVDLGTLGTVTSWGQGQKITYNLNLQSSDLKIKFADPSVSTWTPASGNITI